MTEEEILQWFAVKGGEVCVDRSPVPGHPGFVRHVTLRAPAQVVVEFLWQDTDEGGPTYVAAATSLSEAIVALDGYLGKSLSEWENHSASGRHPPVDPTVQRNREAFREDVRLGNLRLPAGLEFQLRERYWRELVANSRS